MPGEWISVSDRLPEIDRDVLLTDGQEVVQAWLDEDGWQVWHTSQNWRGARAWMPLPKPPADHPRNGSLEGRGTVH
jgi:hypothetical protein